MTTSRQNIEGFKKGSAKLRKELRDLARQHGYELTELKLVPIKNLRAKKPVGGGDDSPGT